MLLLSKDVNQIVDKKKLIYFPVLFIITIIMLAGVLSLHYTKSILQIQLKNDALNYANQAVKYTVQKHETKEMLLNHMEETMSNVGNRILNNKDEISNEWLKEMALDFEISKIFYYSSDGTVIYSAFEDYIGWQSKPGDPIYDFMNSNSSVFHEEIRKGTESDNYYKFSYLKDDEGNFVQLGFFAEEVLANTDSYEYQNIVNEIADDINIYYALITDKNLISIAESDKDKIETDWSQVVEYQEASKGEASVSERYYEKIDDVVYEVTVPFVIDEEVIGVFAIGKSMNSIDAIIRISYIRTGFILLIISLLVLLNQRKNVIQPIIRLNEDISGFYVNKNALSRLEIEEHDIFIGVKNTFNKLLERIEEYVNDIEDTNSLMKYNAYHDHLTGMENRRAMDEYFESLLDYKNKGAVLLLSLSNLSEINDIYGHNNGDFIVRKVAERLTELNSNIRCFKFDRDEFVLIHLGQQSDLDDQIAKLTKTVTEPVIHDNQNFNISCRVGISRFPDDGLSSTKLIQAASTAINYFQDNQRSNYVYYEAFMYDRLLDENRIFTVLSKEIKDKCFKLVYQPIVDTSTGEIANFEALLRLSDNSISPGKFIPVAEKKGLIKSIGEIVIENVIKQLQEWKNKGFEIKPIAINISPSHFIDNQLFEFIRENLEKYHIDPKFIELEITEEVLVIDKEKTAKLVEKFNKYGINTSLDDFGSGYSSLNYLTVIPFSKIKLDKSINDRFLNQYNYKIIESIISISQELGIKVVAEGIEEEKQHDILKELKCDYVQGYLISKPVDTEQIEKMLKINFMEY